MGYDYEYEWDKEYCYPHSDVLINKLGIKDRDELVIAEREITSLKIAVAKAEPIHGNFDFEHLKRIHKFIFEDIYFWAGEFRHVNIAKGNHFCLHQNIEMYAAGIRRMDAYRGYDFVEEVVELDMYHMDKTYEALERLLFTAAEPISILILSDDTELGEKADSTALMYLVYIQDFIKQMCTNHPDYDKKGIQTIVEITDPGHSDIVRGYDRTEAVISNRFTGNMITQIGEKVLIFDFFQDLLRYPSDTSGGASKKLQVKKVSSFFKEAPPACTAYDLVRAVFEASVAPTEAAAKPSPALVLGYIKADGETAIFSGDLADMRVSLEAEDKIIVYRAVAPRC